MEKYTAPYSKDKTIYEACLMNSKSNSKRYLKELGLTPQDVADWNAGEQSLETPAGKKVKVALYRFVDESIVRPNASERPAWASDPRFA